MAQELALLEWHSPDDPPTLVGFILYDPDTNQIQIRMAREYQFVQDDDQQEFLREAERFLVSVVEESGPARCLDFLEENLSNVLRLSSRLRLPAREPDLPKIADDLARLLLTAARSR